MGAWGVVFLIQPDGIPLPPPWGVAGSSSPPPPAAQPHPALQLAHRQFRLPRQTLCVQCLSCSGYQNKQGCEQEGACEGSVREELHSQRSLEVERAGQEVILFRCQRSTVLRKKKSPVMWCRSRPEQQGHTSAHLVLAVLSRVTRAACQTFDTGIVLTASPPAAGQRLRNGRVHCPVPLPGSGYAKIGLHFIFLGRSLRKIDEIIAQKK